MKESESIIKFLRLAGLKIECSVQTKYILNDYGRLLLFRVHLILIQIITTSEIF